MAYRVLRRTGSRPTLMVSRVEDLGPALRDLRLSQGVSVFDAADAMESTHGTSITAYETGRIRPGSRILIEYLATHDYVVVLMHKREAAKLIQDGIRPRE